MNKIRPAANETVRRLADELFAKALRCAKAGHYDLETACVELAQQVLTEGHRTHPPHDPED